MELDNSCFLGSRKAHGVSFSTSINSTHEVPRYDEIYGVHPMFFDFLADGTKLCNYDAEEREWIKELLHYKTVAEDREADERQEGRRYRARRAKVKAKKIAVPPVHTCIAS